MALQNINGRAFEWAVAQSFVNRTQFQLIQNKYSILANESFDQLPSMTQNSFIASAEMAVEHILRKEVQFFASVQKTQIHFNSDRSGAVGDVRDLILTNSSSSLGISCKNNHAAVKHSRLSGVLDFIQSWSIDPRGCSDEYWAKIRPIFDELHDLKIKNLKWSDLPNKVDRFYFPVLVAWQEELMRHFEKNSSTSKALIRYLLGHSDFYKIIQQKNQRVELQAWNFNHSLQTTKTKYPTTIIDIRSNPKSQSSKIIIFDGGYQIQFRIHNASTMVEPSLKFDVVAIGVPTSLYRQTLEV